MFVLVLATVPPLLRQPFDATPPRVLGMPTLPIRSWTVAGGEPCSQHFTNDHMAVTDTVSRDDPFNITLLDGSAGGRRRVAMP